MHPRGLAAGRDGGVKSALGQKRKPCIASTPAGYKLYWTTALGLNRTAGSHDHSEPPTRPISVGHFRHDGNWLQSEVHGLEQAQVNGQGLSDLVSRAVDKLKAPDVEGIMAKLAASGHAHPAQERTTAQGWQEEVVRKAAQTDASSPLPLPEVYRGLKTTWPSLTIGQFHDGLSASARRCWSHSAAAVYAGLRGHCRQP